MLFCFFVSSTCFLRFRRYAVLCGLCVLCGKITGFRGSVVPSFRISVLPARFYAFGFARF